MELGQLRQRKGVGEITALCSSMKGVGRAEDFLQMSLIISTFSLDKWKKQKCYTLPYVPALLSGVSGSAFYFERGRYASILEPYYVPSAPAQTLRSDGAMICCFLKISFFLLRLPRLHPGCELVVSFFFKDLSICEEICGLDILQTIMHCVLPRVRGLAMTKLIQYPCSPNANARIGRCNYWMHPKFTRFDSLESEVNMSRSVSMA